MRWPAALLVLGTAACSTTFTIPRYTVTPARASRHLLVGAHKADITPAAGYPMGGHSLAGRVSRGHWGRLYARAFYLQDSNGSSVAIVACDLFAIPGGLHQRVAQLLHEGADQVEDVGRENLILAASHTHQSPGNFMTSKFYNSLASPYPGFDRQLFEKLAGTIADAIKEAARDARAHPEGGTLTIRTTSAPALVRNRAVKAFGENDPAMRRTIVGQGPPAPPECPQPCPRYRAVDPRITLVRLERRAPIGMLVFFAVHPTVLRHDAPVYSPDFVGLAMRALEREAGGEFVAGFINGAEGDVSPRWLLRDAAETRTLARQFEEIIAARLIEEPDALLGDDTTITTARTAARREVFCDGVSPLPGIAETGGAEDGRFVTFDLGWRAPHRRTQEKPKRFFLLRWLRNLDRRARNQGAKEPALDFQGLPFLGLTELFAPPESFPAEVPVTIASIGTLSILALPIEPTTAVGYQVRSAMQARLPGQQLLIAALANEYYGYVTTEAEYRTQEYEGASTLFGPKTGECYEKLLDGTVPTLRPSTRVSIPAAKFVPGPKPFLKARFGASFWGEGPSDSDEELLGFFARDTRPSPWPTLAWDSDPNTGTALLVCDEQRCPNTGTALLVCDKQRWITQETDDDGRLLTVLTDGSKKHWETIWLPPVKEKRDIEHRLKVQVGEESICSEPFTLEAVSEGSIRFPLPLAAICP